MKFQIDPLPIHVGLEIIGRDGEREWGLGFLHRRKAIPGGMLSRVTSVVPTGDAFDLILQSTPGSMEYVSDTVDIMEIWDGELVYEDVPIEREAPDGP